jgi:16S rRNA (adenine1518-N6/adenine1519-N6)-dimethyltransferase
LQKRSLAKDKNPGVWDSSVSGHLDAGEDYLTAAIRELGEEIVVEKKAEDLKYAVSAKPCEATGWEHIQLFTTQHDGSVDFPAAEIDSMMPFPVSEIEAWSESRPEDFSSAFLQLFRAWREK